MNTKLKQEYIDQYIKLREIKPDYGKGPSISPSSLKIFRKAVKGLNSFGIKINTALDYGCGTAGTAFIKALLPEAKTNCYDPAINKYATKPKPADVIFCNDVMEHIPIENVKPTLNEISSLCKGAVFVIHYGRASNILPNGKNCHVTIRPQYWWENVLKTFFSKVEVVHIIKNNEQTGLPVRSIIIASKS